MIAEVALYSLICFIACTIGAICGIGGGVIIKPTLDMVSTLDVSSVAFLSSCTVLSMSMYSIMKIVISQKVKVTFQTIYLGLGAAIGGVIGKHLLEMLVVSLSINKEIILIQNLIILLLTIVTLLYSLNKLEIKQYFINNTFSIFLIGGSLGLISSFLGIGGGPINILILSVFFGMKPKEAAINSLFIIMCAQITSILSTTLKKQIPVVNPYVLLGMIIAGVVGGIIGRLINDKMKEECVTHFFVKTLYLIMLINIYNIVNFLL